MILAAGSYDQLQITTSVVSVVRYRHKLSLWHDQSRTAGNSGSSISMWLHSAPRGPAKYYATISTSFGKRWSSVILSYQLLNRCTHSVSIKQKLLYIKCRSQRPCRSITCPSRTRVSAEQPERNQQQLGHIVRVTVQAQGKGRH